MTITPDELLEKEFPTSFRGYDKEEVKIFLEEVANALTYVIKERNDLKDQVLLYKKQIAVLKQQEAEFRKALTAAHKAIEDMKENAQKEADLIIERARMDAENIISNAHHELVALEDRIRKLRMFQKDTVNRIRSSLEGFLRIVDEEMMLPPDEVNETLRITAREISAIQQEVPNSSATRQISSDVQQQSFVNVEEPTGQEELELTPESSKAQEESNEQKSEAADEAVAKEQSQDLDFKGSSEGAESQEGDSFEAEIMEKDKGGDKEEKDQSQAHKLAFKLEKIWPEQ